MSFMLGVWALCVPLAAGPRSTPAAGKVPITTSSDEAKTLYLRGRELAEALRATDARALYKQAVEKDGHFALGYVGLANTSGTNKEFIDAVSRAVELAGGVSEGNATSSSVSRLASRPTRDRSAITTLSWSLRSRTMSGRGP
jgi:hypothetical protein